VQATEIKIGDDKYNEVINYCITKFEETVRARANQVDKKYKQWQDNYSGKPLVESRSTPFAGASNFVPQLIRMHTDILSARMCGIIFAPKPFWKIKSWLRSIPHECTEALSEWFEYKCFSGLDFFEPLDRTIFSTVKTGTVVLKAPWVDQTFITFNGKGESRLKEVNGIKLCPIPFDDFYPYPLTAPTLQETTLKIHVLRFAKEEIEYRQISGLWTEEGCKALIESPNPEGQQGTKRDSEAQNAGLTLTGDVSRPYTVIEAWLDYPLDGRNIHKLCLTLNPKRRGKAALLKGVYNYYEEGLEPFVDFRILPRDDLFYGYSIPEILEESQEEQAQIHNSRRDANIIANVPGWKKKMYGNVPDPSSGWYPGKVFELENLDDLDILQFGGNYNSMIEEEQFLLQIAERYTGIGSPAQGTSAGQMEGSRGVYSSGGTLALLAEGNKRLDIFNRRLRLPFHRTGRLIFHSYRDFGAEQLTAELEAFGEAKEFLKRVFNVREPRVYNGVFFDIGASDSGANRELDRQNTLLMANTLSAYYRQVVESSTMLAQIPPDNPLRGILISVLEGAKDLADRLLFLYEIGDRKRLLPNVSEILNGGSSRPGASNVPGAPEAEDSLGLGELSGLSENLAALTGRMSS
jgi:hypothetical protein